MAMIKDALSSLPARPALFIAPLLVVLVLSLYYHDRYQRCVEIRETRTQLGEHLRSLGADARFRLSDFTDFSWTRVRIVAAVKRDTISETCPLDWNWPGDERESLLASDRLSAIIFGHHGRIVRYLELDGDELQFRGAEGNLTPDEAVFDITRGPGGRVELTLVR